MLSMLWRKKSVTGLSTQLSLDTIHALNELTRESRILKLTEIRTQHLNAFYQQLKQEGVKYYRSVHIKDMWTYSV